MNSPSSSLTRAGAAIDISFCSDRSVFPTQRCHALLEWFYALSADEEGEEAGAGGVSLDALGVADRFMELLFQQYFQGGVDPNRPPVKGSPTATTTAGETVFAATASSTAGQAPQALSGGGPSPRPLFAQCALDAGMPPGPLDQYLQSAREQERWVRAALAKDDYAKKQMGVDGVPYFVIENQNDPRRSIVFSGGQPVQKMVAMLRAAVKAQ